MESLTKTLFFSYLKGEEEITLHQQMTLDSAYKEFVHLIIDKCMAAATEIPAFFTLKYARIELAHLQSKEVEAGAKKK